MWNGNTYSSMFHRKTRNLEVPEIMINKNSHLLQKEVTSLLSNGMIPHCLVCLKLGHVWRTGLMKIHECPKCRLAKVGVKSWRCWSRLFHRLYKQCPIHNGIIPYTTFYNYLWTNYLLIQLYLYSSARNTGYMTNTWWIRTSENGIKIFLELLV